MSKTRVEMAREVATLASGTVARLCRSTLYQDIENYVVTWTTWIMAQPVMKRWESWVDCHEEYKRFREGQD